MQTLYHTAKYLQHSMASLGLGAVALVLVAYIWFLDTAKRAVEGLAALL
jgi:hypothetical protein